MIVLASLGPHAAFIVTAYGAALMVVVLLIAWVWLDHRAQRRKLDELEARGITRRSAGTTS
jgi:heme exporter protein D